MAQIRLIKLFPWYNPMHIKLEDDTILELADIKVFKKEGVIISVGRGWFETDSSYGNNPFSELLIDTKKPLVRKLKEDFSKGQPFYMKQDRPYYTNDMKKYILYLPYEDLKLLSDGYSKERDCIYRVMEFENPPVSFMHQVKNLTTRYHEAVQEFNEAKDVFSSVDAPEVFAYKHRRLLEAYQKIEQEARRMKDYSVGDYLKEKTEEELHEAGL